MSIFSFFSLVRQFRRSRLSNRFPRPLRRGSSVPLVLEQLEDRSLPSAVTISGFVFSDANNNGLFDPGESALANSAIELRNASGVVVGSTITDAHGFYAFNTDNTLPGGPATLTETASVPATATDWTNSLAVPQFDPSLGTLTSIDILNAGSFMSHIRVESLDGAPSIITATDSGTLTLSGPGLAGLVTNVSASQNFNATAADGILDFAGTSGHDFGPQTASNSQSTTLASAAALAPFTGTGMVTLTDTAHATSVATGSGNLVTDIATSANAQVTVVYHYQLSTALRPGTYTIHQTSVPAGFLDGLESSNGTVLANSVGSHTIPVVLGAVNSVNNDFGEVQPASLAGHVYVDANDNGIREPSEALLAGVTITLTGSNDLGPVNLTTTTLADGSYQFLNLRPGQYTLTETPPSKYLDGKDAVGTAGGNLGKEQFSAISLAPGAAGLNYDFAELLPASLAGFVYVDANNNGIKESAEAGLSGVAVTLSGSDDTGAAVQISQMTAADGSYSFQNLRPGTYKVTETPPVGYLDGKDAVGSLGGTLGNDQLTQIALTSGSAGSNYNFAELVPGTLSGYVYLDYNNNGVREAGEDGVWLVQVTLTGTDDRGAAVSQVQTTVFPDGSYHFTNLRPGTYTLTETHPVNYVDGKDTLGSLGGMAAPNQFAAIVLNAGAAGTNYNFAELPPGALGGLVYVDSNNNGILENGEARVGAVTITLSGTDDLGQSVNVSQITQNDGSYEFLGLRPGTYVLTLTQPSDYAAGKDTIGVLGGSVGNDQFFAIVLQPGAAGLNYDFGMLPLANALGGSNSGGSSGSSGGSFGKGGLLSSS